MSKLSELYPAGGGGLGDNVSAPDIVYDAYLRKNELEAGTLIDATDTFVTIDPGGGGDHLTFMDAWRVYRDTTEAGTPIFYFVDGTHDIGYLMTSAGAYTTDWIVGDGTATYTVVTSDHPSRSLVQVGDSVHGDNGSFAKVTAIDTSTTPGTSLFTMDSFTVNSSRSWAGHHINKVYNQKVHFVGESKDNTHLYFNGVIIDANPDNGPTQVYAGSSSLFNTPDNERKIYTRTTPPYNFSTAGWVAGDYIGYDMGDVTALQTDASFHYQKIASVIDSTTFEFEEGWGGQQNFQKLFATQTGSTATNYTLYHQKKIEMGFNGDYPLILENFTMNATIDMTATGDDCEMIKSYPLVGKKGFQMNNVKLVENMQYYDDFVDVRNVSLGMVFAFLEVKVPGGESDMYCGANNWFIGCDYSGLTDKRSGACDPGDDGNYFWRCNFGGHFDSFFSSNNSYYFCKHEGRSNFECDRTVNDIGGDRMSKVSAPGILWDVEINPTEAITFQNGSPVHKRTP